MEIQTGFLSMSVTLWLLAILQRLLSDVVRIIMRTRFLASGDALGTTENTCFRAFITLRSQFHQYHCSQRTLTEIVSKITPNLGCPVRINLADAFYVEDVQGRPQGDSYLV